MDSEAASKTTPPQFISVRSVDAESNLSLTLNFGGNAHNLLRPKDEPLGKTMKRICLSATKTKKKGKQPKVKKQRLENKPVNPPIEAHLYFGTKSVAEVPPDTPNSLAWVEGNVFVIGDTRYTISVNPPKVISLSVPSCLMSGHPIVPTVEAEFVVSCSWIWRQYCSPIATAQSLLTAQGVEQQEEPLSLQPSQAELTDLPVVGKSLVYWPNSTDCGHRLLLECVPAGTNGRVGQPVFLVTGEVSPGPSSVTPITTRHKFTPTHLSSPDRFRVVSYNILADYYASSDFARQVLYPYCYPAALDIEYRQCLVVAELLGYHADVMCLQEVGEKSYTQFLQPALQDRGYEGCFSRKDGQIAEGEAIIFNTSKFSLVSSTAVSLKKYLEDDPSCSDLYRALHAVPSVLRSLLTKGTIVLSAFLRCLGQPNHFICVVNTHLYFHPMADHIRLLQVVIGLRFLRASLRQFREAVGQDAKVAVVFVGDFNSCPCIAAYSYMTSGEVSRSHPDWMVYRMTEIPKCNCSDKRPQLSMEDEEEEAATSISETGSVWVTSEDLEQAKSSNVTESEFSGLDLKHEFHFQNACGTEQYTNYTAGYCGVLDYIFFDSDHLELERVVHQPSHEEVTEFVALPSIYFPSDHLAIVADLKWQ